MIGIRSGLRDDVHRCARVRAETRRQRAGFYAEFLQRVRERKRQVHVGHRVGVIAAVQKVRGAVYLSASYGNRRRTVVILAADHGVASRWLKRGAGKQNQLRCLAPIERKIIDALFIDDLRNSGFARFHHLRGRIHLDPFRKSADLQHDIQGHAGTHLQYDSGLCVILESGRFYLQPVWPNREVRKHVLAGGVANGGMHRRFVDFDHTYLRIRNGTAALVRDSAANLSDRDGLGIEPGR